MKLIHCLLLATIIAPACAEDDVPDDDVYPSGIDAINALGTMIEDSDIKTFLVPETVTSSSKYGQLVFDY